MTVFVNECVLIILLLCSSSDQARRRYKLDVYLASLAGILHLLVWFWDVLGIRELHHTLSGTPQKPDTGPK